MLVLDPALVALHQLGVVGAWLGRGRVGGVGEDEEGEGEPSHQCSVMSEGGAAAMQAGSRAVNAAIARRGSIGSSRAMTLRTT